MLWYNEVAAQVQKDISALDWTPLLGDRQWEITSRAKTIDTLRDKLQRDKGTPLPSVQDVAGVRFEAEMSLDEQDAVARTILGFYGHDENSLKDLRATPHSGYRAVHLWLRLPVRVEVQVRTHMQGAWANAYEAAADLIGRDIRYGVLPDGGMERTIVETLQYVSTNAISEAEEARNRMARGRLIAEDLERRGQFRSAEELRDTLDVTWNDYVRSEGEMKRQLVAIHDQFRTVREKG
ncbi:RelA/SpoT domain-containing protein [Microbacterium sp. SLBN-146]|uniref:RelA/SpoT domain-containing protein n=1 Tax=Microbacterium sp. SLBN-146 TaxID=2768457 RepID=UPI00135A64FE|nr:hypothetical protein [Microbacterium sp. SLBN-146]